MSVRIFDTPDVQDFLKTIAGLGIDGGNPRTKQIMHRIVSDLFKIIEDLDITPDEYWAAVAYLNFLGARGEAGLLSPGLGVDRFLDMRMDAQDAADGVENGTPRTIEGPLYVAGAPLVEGNANLSVDPDEAPSTVSRQKERAPKRSPQVFEKCCPLGLATCYESAPGRVRHVRSERDNTRG